MNRKSSIWFALGLSALATSAGCAPQHSEDAQSNLEIVDASESGRALGVDFYELRSLELGTEVRLVTAPEDLYATVTFRQEEGSSHTWVELEGHEGLVEIFQLGGQGFTVQLDGREILRSESDEVTMTDGEAVLQIENHMAVLAALDGDPNFRDAMQRRSPSEQLCVAAQVEATASFEQAGCGCGYWCCVRKVILAQAVLAGCLAAVPAAVIGCGEVCAGTLGLGCIACVIGAGGATVDICNSAYEKIQDACDSGCVPGCGPGPGQASL